jgi:hypothetical protein
MIQVFAQAALLVLGVATVLFLESEEPGRPE